MHTDRQSAHPWGRFWGAWYWLCRYQRIPRVAHHPVKVVTDDWDAYSGPLDAATFILNHPAVWVGTAPNAGEVPTPE